MPVDVDSLITSAIARADSSAIAARDAAASALSNFFVPGGAIDEVTVPALRGTPPVFNGSMNIVADIKQAFADAFADFYPEMQDALADYIARFFPELVRSTTDNWICNTILYGGSGLPADIESAIWERARAQEVLEARRLESEAIDSFAARGFTLPSGAISAQIMQIQQAAADKNSTLSRERAIKAAEMEIENIRLAVQQGVAVRASVLGSLGSYIRAYMSPIELALNKAQLIGDSQQKLWSSAADYYRAMVNEADLSLRAQQINAASQATVLKVQNDALLSAVEARTQAAVSVAKTLGDMAASISSSTISLAGAQTLQVGSV